jgi:undecaprenyl diphosphate synthase
MKQFEKLPNHIAIILDGNGRWAKKRGLPRSAGHKMGVETLIKITRYCSEIGIRNLTVYAFSTENWNRPKEEVDYLMSLIEEYFNGLDKKLRKRNIKLKVIGEKNNLNEKLLKIIYDVEENSKYNTGMILNIAFNYGGKDEIVNAFKTMVNDKVIINKETVDKYLYTSESGNVDLVIRTSGEQRISNFLLWQIAYAEFYFTKTLWPDFNKKDLNKAIDSYLNRDRRYGGLNNEEEK